MNRRLERVNVASLRVALISTGLVAVVYAIVAMLVVVFVTNNLTAQVDSRSVSSLAHYEQPPCFRLPARASTTPGRGTSAPRCSIWVVDPAGHSADAVTNIRVAARRHLPLPTRIPSVTTPITTSAAAVVDVRIAGGPVGSYRLDRRRTTSIRSRRRGRR